MYSCSSLLVCVCVWYRGFSRRRARRRAEKSAINKFSDKFSFNKTRNTHGKQRKLHAEAHCRLCWNSGSPGSRWWKQWQCLTVWAARHAHWGSGPSEQGAHLDWFQRASGLQRQTAGWSDSNDFTTQARLRSALQQVLYSPICQRVCLPPSQRSSMRGTMWKGQHNTHTN